MAKRLIFTRQWNCIAFLSFFTVILRIYKQNFRKKILNSFPEKGEHLVSEGPTISPNSPQEILNSYQEREKYTQKCSPRYPKELIL